MLDQGVDAIGPIPDDRWAGRGAELGLDNIQGGFLQDLDLFDAGHFGISGREAETMDPQQRLMLEVSWEALEHAGIAPDSLKNSATGVFVGITTNDYARMAMSDPDSGLDVYAATGGALNVAAGRIAYTLGFSGPAVAIDTACSSSLVAIHLACQSLRNKECSLALAGGVNVLLAPEPFVCFADWGMMAPDGRCKTFDEKADGFVRSEGCGVLALKRLSDARRDGDPVLAIVRGTAVNQDGASSGLTVPNGLAQEQVLVQSLAAAGLQANDIDYVEAHGTGTTLGDPIELEAIAKIYARKRDKNRPLKVGSVKTNIGHAESASGVAGVIKSILALQHDRIPQHLHFEKLSSRISLRGAPVEVSGSASPWPRSDEIRRAAISSFGFSGTNANVIVEQGDVAEAEVSENDSLQILPLSARTPNGLSDVLRSYQPYLRECSSGELANLCFGAASGRARFNYRAAIVAKDGQSALDAIENHLAGNPDPALQSGAVDGSNKLAFLFTGQGSQSVRMGADLYRDSKVFRDAIDECAVALTSCMSVPLLELLGYTGEESAEELIHRTENTQPALFAFEYAMAQLWSSFGIKPSVLVGHSLGEYVAATVAGVMTLADALKLVAARAALMQALPEGGMMAAVRMDEAACLQVVSEHSEKLSVAAINGAQSCVLSGDHDVLAGELESLSAKGIDSHKLQVSHAFHSPLMQPMIHDFLDVARSIKYAAPTTDLILNESGKLCGDSDIDADYWARHIVNPVRFSASVTTLVKKGYRHFLELGPAPALTAMIAPDYLDADLTLLASQRSGNDGLDQLLHAAAGLFVNGIEPDWGAVNTAGVRPANPLPNYPFQRKRYWLREKTSGAQAGSLGPSVHPLLGTQVSTAPNIQLFDNTVSLERFAFLADHRIGGKVLYPAAAYMEMAHAAARHLFGTEDVTVTDGALREAFVMQPDTHYKLQLLATRQADESYRFDVYSSLTNGANSQWTLHASGSLNRDSSKSASSRDLSTAELDTVDVAALKTQMIEVGLQYGPQFDGLESAQATSGFARGRLQLPAFGADAKDLRVHPGMLDASFHLIGAAINHAAEDSNDRFFLPFSYESARIHCAVGEAATAEATLRQATNEEVCADVLIMDTNGDVAVEVIGLRAKGMSRDEFQLLLGGNDAALHEIVWEESSAGEGAATGRYLVIGGSAEFRAALTGHIESEGGSCTMDSLESWDTLSGVFDLSACSSTAETLAQSSYASIERLRAFVASDAKSDCRYLYVTTGATRAGDSGQVDPRQSALWGLALTAAAELGDRDIRVVDCSDENCAGTLAQLIHRDDAETRFALVGNEIRVPRLQSAADASQLVAPYRLTLGEQRSVKAIGFAASERGRPQAGQVELEVLATGVNFRDVLTALGMYPGPASDLGNECCGRVVTLGEGVDSLQIGDLVTSIADSTFSSHVIADQELCFKVPASLSLAQAAVFPIAQLTAYLSLHEIGKMQANDWVLIHAGAGGVGLAAVYLAKAAGAKIIATAGSDAKREFLRTLGVDAVFDSRSLLAAEKVLSVTDGKGVDIVLNSLTDEAIDEGLKSLAEGGRFVEIGLRDLRDDAAISALGKSISYHPVLLGDNCREQP
ncbi:MAG: beta-ketoacyl synthase N-terminal-like domain-containing protein [Pseudomonadota bacterium]